MKERIKRTLRPKYRVRFRPIKQVHGNENYFKGAMDTALHAVLFFVE